MNLQQPMRLDDEHGLQQAMSSLAAAIADPSRVSILCALMDGRAWTATELSMVADIAASTASGHLHKLLHNGLIVCVCQGRHRYYRLAGAQIAQLLEMLMGVSMRPAPLPAPKTPVNLRYSRTCYDHLAGELAVSIYDFMIKQQWIVADGTMLTEHGITQFQQLGVERDPKARRKACCPCLDWSERRYHLGGEAGAALMRFMLQRQWLQPIVGYREMRVSAGGKIALKKVFNISSRDR